MNGLDDSEISGGISVFKCIQLWLLHSAIAGNIKIRQLEHERQDE